MNIFASSPDPTESATVMADRHVIKQTLETAQLLSTTVRTLLKDADIQGLYKVAYVNHPVTKWTRQSRLSFKWTAMHGLALATEYNRRFGKEHASLKVIKLAESFYHLLPDVAMPTFTLAMPNEFKSDDPHLAYRKYLLSKYLAWGSAARWTNSTPPNWIQAALVVA